MGGGGILDDSGNFIAESFVVSGKGESYELPENPEYDDSTVVYIGMFVHTWGHCITDNIKFLWFINSEAYKNNFKNCPLIYIPLLDPLFDFESNGKNFRRFLEILGLNFKKLKSVDKVTQYKTIILPDESFFTMGTPNVRFFTNEYVETVNIVKKFAIEHSHSVANKRIYYFHGLKNQKGEERIAQYFHSKGYEIISPENLSLDEQLNILVNCKSFVSTMGSCSHNMIFLREGTQVALIPRLYKIPPHTVTLSQAFSNLNITYVDSTLSLCTHINGQANGYFCYIISSKLMQYIGDLKDIKDFEYQNEDFLNFIDYLRFIYSKGLNIYSEAYDYYGEYADYFLRQLEKRNKDIVNIERNVRFVNEAKVVGWYQKKSD